MGSNAVYGLDQDKSKGAQEDPADSEEIDSYIDRDQHSKRDHAHFISHQLCFQKFPKKDIQDENSEQDSGRQIIALENIVNSPGQQDHTAAQHRKGIEQGDGQSDNNPIRIVDQEQAAAANEPDDSNNNALGLQIG